MREEGRERVERGRGRQTKQRKNVWMGNLKKNQYWD